jgi:hypothetical protein
LRHLIFAVALLAIGGCGGSSSSGGSGGSAGAQGGSGGAAGGSGGATGGSGGSAGGFSQCFDASGNFTAFEMKTCGGASCVIVAHQVSCCGDVLLIGVEQIHQAELEACEQAWLATQPQCGCPTGPPQIEQPSGTTVADESSAAVGCINWTQSSGVCMTQPK